MPDESDERNRFVGSGQDVDVEARHCGGRGRPLGRSHRRQAMVGVVPLGRVLEMGEAQIWSGRVAELLHQRRDPGRCQNQDGGEAPQAGQEALFHCLPM